MYYLRHENGLVHHLSQLKTMVEVREAETETEAL